MVGVGGEGEGLGISPLHAGCHVAVTRPSSAWNKSSWRRFLRRSGTFRRSAQPRTNSRQVRAACRGRDLGGDPRYAPGAQMECTGEPKVEVKVFVPQNMKQKLAKY